MDVDNSAGSLDLPFSKVTMLHGHQSEVFTCAWSPQGDTIVSGYGKFDLIWTPEMRLPLY